MPQHVQLQSWRRQCLWLGLLAGLASTASFTASSTARAQDEMSESPVQTLAEDSPPPKRGKKSASLTDAPEPLSPKQADKRAREEFEAGRVAWEDGQFREAWEHWHLSYRLSRKPELLYNVGQAADRLRMDREALEAFRMYLDKNPNATNRREVEQRIEILERSVAAQPPAERARDSGASLHAQPGTLQEGSSEASFDASDASDGSMEPASTTGQPGRSGLYVRLSAGLGLLADSISDNAGNPGSLGSATFVLEGAVGYGVLEKLVVGGVISLDIALAPGVSQNGGAVTDLNSVSMLLVSAFADYYLSPKTHGWHLFGGLGIGRLAISDPGATLGNQDGGGGALFAGGGYDMPLSREWVLAFNARLLIGRFSQDVFDHTLIAPTVTVGAVWF